MICLDKLKQLSELMNIKSIINIARRQEAREMRMVTVMAAEKIIVIMM